MEVMLRVVEVLLFWGIAALIVSVAWWMMRDA